MRKSTLLFAAVLAFGSFSAADSAFAQSSSANGNDSSGAAQQIVNDAAQTIQKIKADGGYDQLLKQAKGIFIMPTVVKGAFIVGGQGAQGVLLKRESNGRWSEPAFMTIGSISVGAQAGGKAGPAAFILMTDKAVNNFVQANNVSLNANAGLTIINYSAQGHAPNGKGDVVVWSEQSGIFAGADVGGAKLFQNTGEDRAFYGKPASAEQILEGKVNNPQADKLRTQLPA